MASDRDDLDTFVADRTKQEPQFAVLYESARRRRVILGQLAATRRALGASRTAVAARMGTSEAAVARLESGEVDPRWSTLDRYAAAVGKRLDVSLAEAS